MENNEKNHVRIEFRAKNNILLSEREKRGLTQTEMAEEIGIDLSFYGMMERFQKVPEHILLKTAMYFRIDVAVLFPEWAASYGMLLNGGKKYFLVSDDIAQKVIDDRPDDVMQKLLAESFEGDLDSAMNFMTERGKDVVKSYFGINTPMLTIEEIGEKYKISRERVRQIKEKAIRRLRHNCRSGKLRQYIGEEFRNPE